MKIKENRKAEAESHGKSWKVTESLNLFQLRYRKGLNFL